VPVFNVDVYKKQKRNNKRSIKKARNDNASIAVIFFLQADERAERAVLFQSLVRAERAVPLIPAKKILTAILCPLAGI